MTIKIITPFPSTVLDTRKRPDGEVLVLLHRDDKATTPYVSYRVDREDNCHHGHYIREHFAATADYNRRAKEFSFA